VDYPAVKTESAQTESAHRKRSVCKPVTALSTAANANPVPELIRDVMPSVKPASVLVKGRLAPIWSCQVERAGAIGPGGHQAFLRLRSRWMW